MVMSIPPRRRLLKACAAFGLAAFANTASAEGEAIQYTGAAFDLESGALVYREAHFVELDAEGRGERIVMYRCPEGPAFARKRVVYRDESAAPIFNYLDGLTGYREGVAEKDGAREVYYTKGKESEPRSAPLPKAQNLVVDAGFDRFVRQNWDALERGEAVKFAFLLPSALDYYTFKIRKERSEQIAGREASVIRLSLSGILGYFVPHIDVAYGGANGEELLRYAGISNVRDEKRENRTVRIDFPPDERAPLKAEERTAALEEPLVGSCKAAS